MLLKNVKIILYLIMKECCVGYKFSRVLVSTMQFEGNI